MDDSEQNFRNRPIVALKVSVGLRASSPPISSLYCYLNSFIFPLSSLNFQSHPPDVRHSVNAFPSSILVLILHF